MKKIIFCMAIVLSSSSLSFAGGEPLYYYIHDNACGALTESGEIILKETEKCSVEVYSDINSDFWVEYRPIGSTKFIKFSKKNSLRIIEPDFVDNKTITIPMKGTGEYHIAFDTNNNGYPDFTSSALWLYEAETK